MTVLPRLAKPARQSGQDRAQPSSVPRFWARPPDDPGVTVLPRWLCQPRQGGGA